MYLTYCLISAIVLAKGKNYLNMKKILIALTVCVCAFVGKNDAIALDTNLFDLTKVAGSFTKPFPDPFDGMLKTNLISGVTPAAVYVISERGMVFGCVGTCFACDTNNKYAILLPEHLFFEGTGYSYAIRMARPGNKNVNGFIQEINLTSKDFGGLDLIQATIGTQSKVIKGVFNRPYMFRASFCPSNTVTFAGKTVHTIKSYINGKEARILGTGLINGSAVTNICTVIEFKSHGGYSGTPFYDEYNRLYFLNAGPDTNEIASVAYLIGPIELEHH